MAFVMGQVRFPAVGAALPGMLLLEAAPLLRQIMSLPAGCRTAPRIKSAAG